MKLTESNLNRRQIIIDIDDLDTTVVDGITYHSKPVPDYEGYHATTLGNVISYKSGKPILLKPFKMNKQLPYFRVTLSGKNLRLHRVIASAFLARSIHPCRGGQIRKEINHKKQKRHSCR